MARNDYAARHTEAARQARIRYKKRKRAERKALGLCRKCGSVDTRGYSLCPKHREKAVNYQRARAIRLNGGVPPQRGRKRVPVEEQQRRKLERRRQKEQERRTLGLCVVCGVDSSGQYYCNKHARQHDREAVREQRRIRKELGLCAECGALNDTKGANCSGCRKLDVASRAVIVAERHAKGLCVCKQPLLPGGKICETCWFRHEAQKSIGLGRREWQSLKNLLIAQGFQCPYSGEFLQIGSPNATLDHKIPRSRGGSNKLDNLQWVTKRMNEMKTDFTHEEFLEACAEITERWQKKQTQLHIA